MASPILIAGPATYAAGSRRPDLQFDAEEEPSESNYTFSNTLHVRWALLFEQLALLRMQLGREDQICSLM